MAQSKWVEPKETPYWVEQEWPILCVGPARPILNGPDQPSKCNWATLKWPELLGWASKAQCYRESSQRGPVGAVSVDHYYWAEYRGPLLLGCLPEPSFIASDQ